MIPCSLMVGWVTFFVLAYRALHLLTVSNVRYSRHMWTPRRPGRPDAVTAPRTAAPALGPQLNFGRGWRPISGRSRRRQRRSGWTPTTARHSPTAGRRAGDACCATATPGPTSWSVTDARTSSWASCHRATAWWRPTRRCHVAGPGAAGEAEVAAVGAEVVAAVGGLTPSVC